MSAHTDSRAEVLKLLRDVGHVQLTGSTATTTPASTPAQEEIASTEQRNSLTKGIVVPEATTAATAADEETAHKELQATLAQLQKLPELNSLSKFRKWYQQVESALDKEDMAACEAYHRDLKTAEGWFSGQLESLKSIDAMLSNLTVQHLLVSQRTSALHEACEDLVAAQEQSLRQADELKEKLTYFDAVDRSARRIEGTTFSIKGGLDILDSLDKSVAFLESHPTYRAAESYLTRAKQLHYKVSFVLRSLLTQQIAEAMGKASRETDGQTLDYNEQCGRLGYQLEQVSPPFVEVLQRNRRLPQLYGHISSEIFRYYVVQRENLVWPETKQRLAELDAQISKTDGRISDLARDMGLYLRMLCVAEEKLFNRLCQGDVSASNALVPFLRRLCETIYDYLRPRLIYEHDMSNLLDVCETLQLDVIDEETAMNAMQALRNPTQDRTANTTAMMAAETAVYQVVQQLMEDVQEKLIYRMDSFIQKQITAYVLSVQDYAAFTKDTSSTEVQAAGASRGDKVFRQPLRWYQPMQTTLLVISRLYRCVHRSVFEGLAQDLLSACLLSIETAAREIQSRAKPSADLAAMNGHLFLVYHYLVLREQLAPFDVRFVATQHSLDFTSMYDAAYNLVRQGSVFDFISKAVPRSVSQELDGRADLDKRLRTACMTFIDITMKYVCPEMIATQQQIDKVLVGVESAGDLKTSSWASKEALASLKQSLEAGLKDRMPVARRKLHYFLRSEGTEGILWDSVVKRISEAYGVLMRMVRSEYNDAELSELNMADVTVIERQCKAITSVVDAPHASAEAPTAPADAPATAASPQQS
eukprot:Clim_evm39s77 gene=Clim_evmTU39s77